MMYQSSDFNLVKGSDNYFVNGYYPQFQEQAADGSMTVLLQRDVPDELGDGEDYLQTRSGQPDELLPDPPGVRTGAGGGLHADVVPSPGRSRDCGPESIARVLGPGTSGRARRGAPTAGRR